MKDLFRYRLDLQMFADDDDDGLIDMDDDDGDDDNVDPADWDFGDDDKDDGDDDADVDADVDHLLEDKPAPETKPDPKPDDKPEKEDKPEQDAETNAKFAEQRRQKQAEERAQALLKETPEYKLAKTLADMYNVDVPTMMQRLEDARLAKQAEEQKVPVEVLKKIDNESKERQRLQDELLQLKYQGWESRVNGEVESLKTKYPMLNDDDFAAAKTYMLQTLRDPDGPVERAVFALHGAKIYEKVQEMSKTEALAEVSGRKKGPLPPQTSASSAANSLTEEERRTAKMLGISEADYLKHK